MDASALTRYLHANIPLTSAMQLEALSAAPERVVLRLPLDANRNHKGTMFGGSLAALATLACWSLIHVRMQADGIAGELVVTRSEIDYTAPVAAACTAVCEFSDDAAWERCKRLLARRNAGRLSLTSGVWLDATAPAATFRGDFAIMRANVPEAGN